MKTSTTTSLSGKFVYWAKQLLPMPFTIAVLLTLSTLILALIITKPNSNQLHFVELLGYWEGGFFAFLTFAMQMMLILVLGHVLALSKPINTLINSLLGFCTTTAKAAFFVTLLTIIMALINWGLGLIFGAIFARKVGEYAQKNKTPLNYPLIGAAGYAGLMVWHGGLSGSAPVKVAEAKHELVEQTGQILLNDTIFSTMNIVACIALLILLPLSMYWLGTKVAPHKIQLPRSNKKAKQPVLEGAEHLDHSTLLAVLFGLLMLGIALFKPFTSQGSNSWSFLNLNYINFTLFGLGILLHGSFKGFTDAVGEAISGSAGIMIQFPLYAGIMGIMKGGGTADTSLIYAFSEFFVSISNETTFPIFTFFSAGLVNVFVPSGGGQWLVQGPIIVEASKALNIPLSKSIMALAYGDQITNMMQPFWALPLLGITGLKAKQILPYTLFLMLIGIVIFISILLIF